MSRYRLALIVCVIASMSPLVSAAQNKGEAKIPLPSEVMARQQPWQMVRKLQRAQDEIVAGKNGSLNRYRNMLLAVSGQMLKLPDSAWKHQKNLTAAAVYVLIGGNPAIGQKAITHADITATNTAPLIAANAYAARNFSLAFKTMTEIDHTKLPVSAAAQFALIKSMVFSSSDLEKAAQYLNEARRLAPGTLIEEAALRRSLRIVGERREFENLKTDAGIYYRHFSKSKYFGDFLKNYAYAIARMPVDNQDAVLAYIKEFMGELDSAQQLNVLIYIARTATVSGRVKLAHWASNNALSQIDKDSPIARPLTLYASASGIVQDKYFKPSLEQFNQIERRQLSKNDQRLYDAISALSKRLNSAPVDLERVKEILRVKQQIFPGDEPIISTELELEPQILAGNSILKRSKELLDQATSEIERNAK